MSVFYCNAHNRWEDSDYVGYYRMDSGDELCEDAYADLPDSEESAEATDDGWG